MLTPLTHPKLRHAHLTRPALVYVRQSTLMQVRAHTASTARQYHLATRAHELGWSDDLIVVIDQDQGRSGASTAGRDGFAYLMAEVGLGRAGAVLCLEASRLARSSSDWYRLIDLDSGFTNLHSFVRSDMGCWVYEQNNPLPHRPDR